MNPKYIRLRNILYKYVNQDETFVEKYGELSKDEASFLVAMIPRELAAKILAAGLSDLPPLCRDAAGVWIRRLREEGEAPTPTERVAPPEEPENETVALPEEPELESPMLDGES